MNGLSGMDLLKMTKEFNPQSLVFIISGMMDLDHLYSKEIKSGLVAGVISKPFDVEALVKKIEGLLK